MKKIDHVYRKIKELLDNINLEKLINEFERQIREYNGKKTKKSNTKHTKK